MTNLDFAHKARLLNVPFSFQLSNSNTEKFENNFFETKLYFG